MEQTEPNRLYPYCMACTECIPYWIPDVMNDRYLSDVRSDLE